jgi:hypothetical protein
MFSAADRAPMPISTGSLQTTVQSLSRQRSANIKKESSPTSEKKKPLRKPKCDTKKRNPKKKPRKTSNVTKEKRKKTAKKKIPSKKYYGDIFS